MKLTTTIDVQGLKTLSPAIKSSLVNGVTEGSFIMTSFIQNKHLRGGTSSDKLKVRSGKLSSSTRPLETKIEKDSIRGGLHVGTFYASTHIGPKGKITVIKPKKSKYLTIPLPPAMTSSGQMRKRGARSYPNLKFIPGQGGKDPILAQVENGAVTPFFVLKKRVEIKTRIHPEEIGKKTGPMVVRAIDKHLQKGLDKA